MLEKSGEEAFAEPGDVAAGLAEQLPEFCEQLVLIGCALGLGLWAGEKLQETSIATELLLGAGLQEQESLLLCRQRNLELSQRGLGIGQSRFPVLFRLQRLSLELVLPTAFLVIDGQETRPFAESMGFGDFGFAILEL